MLEYLSDKTIIYDFLRNDPFLHLYSIGDLDDFFWDKTQFLGWIEGQQVFVIFLLYEGDPECPTLVAIEESNRESANSLFSALEGDLPKQFYGHISPHLVYRFEPGYRMELLGHRLKMGLRVMDFKRAGGIEGYRIVQLGTEDQDRLLELYRIAYPQNWFDPRMIETGKYLGLERDSKLVAAAGVHVYSAEYRVAALGNIATHPSVRGLGLGTHVTCSLCEDLFNSVDYIGLNVDETNHPAIRCYEKLGFRRHSKYDEFLLTRKRS